MSEENNIRVNNMSIDTPVDTKFGQNGFGGGEPKIYFDMLMQLEQLSLLSTMEKIVPTIDGNDYLNYKHQAHSLKGASGYIGASRVHYACYYI